MQRRVGPTYLNPVTGDAKTCTKLKTLHQSFSLVLLTHRVPRALGDETEKAPFEWSARPGIARPSIGYRTLLDFKVEFLIRNAKGT